MVSFTRYDLFVTIQAIISLSRALQHYPARDLHTERHGDRDAMTCYHRVGTPQCRDVIAF